MGKSVISRRGTDLWMIQPSEFDKIVFPDIDEDGRKLNKRDNFSDIPDFAKKIVTYGKIEVPVIGYIKDGFINITNGERRTRAAMYAYEKLGVEILIPFITEKKGTSIVDRLYKQVRLNNHLKQFTPVEEAEVVAELINQGVDENEIRTQLDYSKVYICNLKLLQKAPDKIKKVISDKIISSTLAMDILRETKNFDEAIALIENAISLKTTGTDNESGTKITKKDIVKSQGKVNSFSAVKKALKKADKRQVRMDKIDLFNILKALNEGQYTLEFLMSELYEPEVEKEKKKKSKKTEQLSASL